MIVPGGCAPFTTGHATSAAPRADGPYRLPIGESPTAKPRPILASYDGATELECGLGILLGRTDHHGILLGRTDHHPAPQAT